jgi:transposase
MKAYRYITLTPSELVGLQLGYEKGEKHHFRVRCQAILLSNEKWTVPELAIHFGKHCDTIHDWFNNYSKYSIEGLKIKLGRGRKALLSADNESVCTLVKKKIALQPLKVLSILDDISKAIDKKISKDTLIKFLKSIGYSYRRIRKALKKSPDEAIYNQKLDEITDLIRLEKKKFLKMYYVDESGFNETPCVPYGWQLKKEPLSIPTQKGQRWNVFGIMSSDNELYAHKTSKSITSEFVIGCIDQFVQNPNRAPQAVLLIDNAKIHHSDLFKAKIPQWLEEGVRIFYLPTYSPHLNRIETLWRKCKYEWLLPEDYQSWKALTEKIEHILANFGTEYNILFHEF